MEWNLQTAGALARYDCPACRATGLASVSQGLAAVPCACVCRRVFQVCYRRFRRCATADPSARIVAFNESPRGVDRHLVWVRRNEDYCADFQASGRRALNDELYRVFRFYHLLGGAAELVARRTGLSLRQLFRHIGQIEQLVGREVALMEPYSLYPPKDYMRAPFASRSA